MQKIMDIVEEFMNIHISTNALFTVAMFLVVYGGYFVATYFSCKRIIGEDQM
ncbi:MAG: hypothetical protein GX096_13225 [Clostridiales bacterium]|nr:hypothetical protein [Clostridiales bacterium]